ncbi:Helix-turn-helix domain-containing protein [Lentzea fradiae]|uniref:Helix-turn-helix domain-containing protein n=1 Tax=Lentzea fradiae TaxID=200378 RepID=A0A1G7NY94_9PSEU|nr:helix-turn-helix transcriptional regulator [Lentzea fradiae]SDF78974.1 Helix-turn-helix domain-containing protein [Lentzea fradiae]
MDLAELGLFLQSRRARITPADVNLPAGARRRVPGLRRDEVAQLAGASVDYYIELERGRGAQPSGQMLVALARALRLGDDERDHLFHLAGRPAPPPHGASAHVPPAMLALLDRLDGTPARIITDLHETLVQNQLATALLGPVVPGSFLERWFTEPEVRGLYPEEDHPHHSKVMVSDLRAAVARRAPSERAAAMVRRLRGVSAEFAALWESGDVAVRRGEVKRIVHSGLGVVEVLCQNLFSEDGFQRLQFFVAVPGGVAGEQLRSLRVGETGLTGTGVRVRTPDPAGTGARTGDH